MDKLLCGDWISCEYMLPMPKVDVLFLAEFGGKLAYCFGVFVEDNLWIDKLSQDRDGCPLDVWTVKYWMPLPIMPIPENDGDLYD